MAGHRSNTAFAKEHTLSRKTRVSPKSSSRAAGSEEELLARIVKSLDDDKAEDILTIDMKGRSSLCDALVVATGTSSRHVASTAEHLSKRLKEAGVTPVRAEGLPQGDWVLIDAGDVIVHIFRPEVRAYYDLEGMWSVDEAKTLKPAAAIASR